MKHLTEPTVGDRVRLEPWRRSEQQPMGGWGVGGPDPAWVPGVARIAVLRANAVGDFIFTLPALAAVKAAYPGAELVLLGAPWHERFLSGRPGPVDRVLVVPPQ